MSLATRCSACTTVFRVVQDQLKVSEGWVRCGRCSHVFNALEGLFDLERDAPPGVAASGGNSPAAAAAALEVYTNEEAAIAARQSATSIEAVVTDAAENAESQPFNEKIDAQLRGARESRHDATPARRISERDRLEFPDAQFDSDMLAEETLAPAADSASIVTKKSAVGALDSTHADTESAEPGFVQRAQQRARQQRPAVRALQASVVLLLAAGFSVQAAHHFRASLAARWPAAESSLSAWCRLTACTIGAPRHIDDVAVESTSLVRVDSADAFRLSVVLRNRSAGPVALPSIDLGLTDVTGQVISRRMLSPRDFQVASTAIKPGAESALQLVLAVDGAPVAGYTVEVFYP